MAAPTYQLGFISSWQHVYSNMGLESVRCQILLHFNFNRPLKCKGATSPPTYKGKVEWEFSHNPSQIMTDWILHGLPRPRCKLAMPRFWSHTRKLKKQSSSSDHHLVLMGWEESVTHTHTQPHTCTCAIRDDAPGKVLQALKTNVVVTVVEIHVDKNRKPGPTRSTRRVSVLSL